MDTKPLYHSEKYSLIIADLHLSDKAPETTALLLAFLQHKAIHADALYILGDLFEFWIGDDDLTELHQQVISALRKLTDAGVDLYFINGNRDFLLGAEFMRAVNATLLPEVSSINFYGMPTVLLHGDTLCTDDVKYQRYRRIVNQAWLQHLFLALPLSLRRKIAKKIRRHSQNQKVYQDVNAKAVQQILSTYQAKCMIHGHTHRFAWHLLPEDHQRLVLGDWHEYGSYIELSSEGISLNAFDINALTQSVDQHL